MTSSQTKYIRVLTSVADLVRRSVHSDNCTLSTWFNPLNQLMTQTFNVCFVVWTAVCECWAVQQPIRKLRWKFYERTSVDLLPSHSVARKVFLPWSLEQLQTFPFTSFSPNSLSPTHVHHVWVTDAEPISLPCWQNRLLKPGILHARHSRRYRRMWYVGHGPTHGLKLATTLGYLTEPSTGALIFRPASAFILQHSLLACALSESYSPSASYLELHFLIFHIPHGESAESGKQFSGSLTVSVPKMVRNQMQIKLRPSAALEPNEHQKTQRSPFAEESLQPLAHIIKEDIEQFCKRFVYSHIPSTYYEKCIRNSGILENSQTIELMFTVSIKALKIYEAQANRLTEPSVWEMFEEALIRHLEKYSAAFFDLDCARLQEKGKCPGTLREVTVKVTNLDPRNFSYQSNIQKQERYSLWFRKDHLPYPLNRIYGIRKYLEKVTQKSPFETLDSYNTMKYAFSALKAPSPYGTERWIKEAKKRFLRGHRLAWRISGVKDEMRTRSPKIEAPHDLPTILSRLKPSDDRLKAQQQAVKLFGQLTALGFTDPEIVLMIWLSGGIALLLFGYTIILFLGLIDPGDWSELKKLDRRSGPVHRATFALMRCYDVIFKLIAAFPFMILDCLGRTALHTSRGLRESGIARNMHTIGRETINIFRHQDLLTKLFEMQQVEILSDLLTELTIERVIEAAENYRDPLSSMTMLGLFNTGLKLTEATPDVLRPYLQLPRHYDRSYFLLHPSYWLRLNHMQTRFPAPKHPYIP
ncbi:unnamed protein product [Calicophoron daubneyi]|uniref:Uncharacterized protein n=1 Tax=Calicophoron daubneyi TaxID=300641 RepID=A0AAV2TF86_CALDB